MGEVEAALEVSIFNGRSGPMVSAHLHAIRPAELGNTPSEQAAWFEAFRTGAALPAAVARGSAELATALPSAASFIACARWSERTNAVASRSSTCVFSGLRLAASCSIGIASFGALVSIR